MVVLVLRDPIATDLKASFLAGSVVFVVVAVVGGRSAVAAERQRLREVHAALSAISLRVRAGDDTL